MKKSNIIARTLGTVTHTHTHTQVFYRIFKERRKLIYNFFLLLWSKGGSREHYGIALLPRDLV
ncbi:MAG: hypothetical protein K6B70_01310 [Clostridia bacterium]|nr:hypothetical protein [Clostridia bacterium]